MSGNHLKLGHVRFLSHFFHKSPYNWGSAVTWSKTHSPGDSRAVREAGDGAVWQSSYLYSTVLYCTPHDTLLLASRPHVGLHAGARNPGYKYAATHGHTGNLRCLISSFSVDWMVVSLRCSSLAPSKIRCCLHKGTRSRGKGFCTVGIVLSKHDRDAGRKRK